MIRWVCNAWLDMVAFLADFSNLGRKSTQSWMDREIEEIEKMSVYRVGNILDSCKNDPNRKRLVDACRKRLKEENCD